MSQKLNVAILLAIVCFVAHQACQAQMVGGLHDEKPVDDEVRKVLSAVHSDFEKMAKREYKSLKPLSYRKQVVAGANYFIKALATDKDGVESHVHLRVYKSFRGNLELTAIRVDQDKMKPLEYFD